MNKRCKDCKIQSENGIREELFGKIVGGKYERSE